jgi:hypothetical protein
MSAASTLTPVKLVINQDGSVNWVSPWFERSKWHLLTWNPPWTSNGSPAGTFSIEATNDPAVIGETAFSSASNHVFAPTISVFHGTWPTLPGTATAGRAGVATSEGFAFERLKYTASGGAGCVMNVWIAGRQQ